MWRRQINAPRREAPKGNEQESKMQFKNIILAAAAAVTLTSGAALAAPAHSAHPIQIADSRWDRHHDRWDRHDRSDRFDRRHYVGHDRVYRELRARHYRYVGTPYFYRGHYVVRAYDSRGRLGFVRVNPYSGSYIGFSFRL
jgi:Ni/Co efflux regulator RcnB